MGRKPMKRKAKRKPSMMTTIETESGETIRKRLTIGDELPGFGKILDIVDKTKRRGRPPKKRRARRKGEIPIRRLIVVEYKLPDDLIENFDKYNPFSTDKGGNL